MKRGVASALIWIFLEQDKTLSHQFGALMHYMCAINLKNANIFTFKIQRLEAHKGLCYVA
jgi:hypothetical protein